MEIRHKIWLEKFGERVYRSGLNELFGMIGRGQSLQAAAKKLKISYRTVWGEIRTSEKRLGIDLVDIDPHKRKMRLTNEAIMLLKMFNDMETEILPILKKTEKKFSFLKKKGRCK